MKKIAMASDHAGFKLKQQLKEYLQNKGYEIYDFGTHSEESVDYPDFIHPLAEAVERGEFDLGLIMCGSGNGVAITANKHQGIRAAYCWNEEIARLARMHNDANVCALPGRFIAFDYAKVIVDAFLNAQFEGGRHQRRVNKIPVKNS
jgi:ribose 5-phosphate isomerase B